MKVETKQIVWTAAIVLLLLSVWSDPNGTANWFGDAFDEIGGFLSDAGDRATEFVEGLGD